MILDSKCSEECIVLVMCCNLLYYMMFTFNYRPNNFTTRDLAPYKKGQESFFATF